MKNAFVGVFFAVVTLSTTVMANDLSRVRCENPEFVKFIKESLMKMKFSDGTSLSQYLGNNSQLTATTIGATKTSVACKVTVNYSIQGGTKSVRGKFTYREFGSDKASTEWAPFY